MRDTTAKKGEMKKRRIEKIKTFQAGIYLRLSVEDGDKKESESIGSQRRMLEDFMKQREDMVFIREYVDDGCTGTNFERPGFQKMLKDVENGKINCVIVKDLSRFGRNHIDTEIYITRHFKEYGVRFIAVNDNFDTLTNGYDIMFSIRNIFNEQYSRDISKKINSSIKAKQKAGEFIGAFPSYGYVKSAADRHKLEIDPEPAEVVKRIFALYLEGVGKVRIASILNSENILCPSEYKKLQGMNYKNSNRPEQITYWTYSTIDKILKNQMYAGDMTQGRKHCEMRGPVHSLEKSEWVIVENTHPAIIDRETWEQTQRMLTIRHTDIILAEKPNVFAGLVRCVDCGYAMVRKHCDNNYNYLECGAYRRSGYSHCSSHSIRAELLEKIILNDLNTMIQNIKNIRKLLEEAKEKDKFLRSSAQVSEVEKKNIEKSLNRTSKLIKKTFEMYAMDEISAEEYMSYRSQYLEQEKQLKARLKAIEEKIEKKEEEKGLDSPWIAHLLEYGEIKELTREILLEAVEGIIVGKNKTVEITYRFGDEYNRLMQSVVD